MGKIPKMSEIREASEPYIKLCKNCNHPGLMHMKQDFRDPSRQRPKVGEFGECSKCKSNGKSCKKFIPQ
jgi:hypothetical protein